MEKLLENKKICVVGLGLIGGTYAKALTGAGHYVSAIDKDAETVKYALENGIVARCYSGDDESTISDILGAADIIAFALYPKTLIEWLARYGSLIPRGALVTDATGIKSAVVYEAQRILPDGVEFIGAHPMAGREKSGVYNSDINVFKGANYIVTPTEKNTPLAIETCMALGRELGFENITTLTPEKHDEMIAFLSQLTHCIAVALMNCPDAESGIIAEYTGDSFRDLTRIAKINGAMWSELFLLNKEKLLDQMNMFSETFDKLKRALENDNREEMLSMMKLSKKRREAFDKPENCK